MSPRFELLEKRRLMASIAGTVYNDLDGSGVQDGGEPGIINRTVYLDDDNDGVKDGGETSVLTDANGDYIFSDLSADTYVVRTVIPAGWVQTEPSGGQPITIFLSNGQDVEDTNFGTHIVPGQTGDISGVVYDDTDGDGVLDAGEVGTTGATVYLDLNDDETLDAGEDFVTTDANGAYEFADVGIGTYAVRVDLLAGSTQTFPILGFGYDVTLDSINNQFTTADFYVTTRTDVAQVGGLVFEDTDRDGTQDSGENPLVGITVYIDENANSSLDVGELTSITNDDGFYFFAGLDAGTYDIRQELQTNFSQTTPAADASQTVTLVADTRTTDVDFGQAVAPSSIAGLVFFDADGNGVFDLTEVALENRTVYIDTDNDGVKDNSETSAVTGFDGGYVFDNLVAGTYRIRQVLQTAWVQTTPAANAPITIVLGVATDEIDKDFGTRPNPNLTGSVTGTIYNDADGDGVLDAGEVGVAGRTVYLDANDDGVLDTGEVTTTTDANGIYLFSGISFATYKVRTVIPTGFKQTLPKLNAAVTATISSNNKNFTGGNFLTTDRIDLADLGGVVFNDGNRNGVQDTNDPGLPNIRVYIDGNNNRRRELSEVSTLTDSTGSYFFPGLVAGTYNIRQILQANWIQTTPAANTSRVVVLTAGELNDAVDFGTAITPATISGVVFDDKNGNGARDLGEKGLSGWVVYIDANSNGAQDGGEISANTNGSGAYTLSSLDAGTYRITTVLKPGFRNTTPAFVDVTVTSSQSLPNTNFGVTSRGNVSGSVFNDKNTSRTRDAGEVGIKNFKIYIDTNDNSRLDAGEAFVLSDSAGNFTLTNVITGTYKIRAVPQSKYKLTTPITGFLTATVSDAGTVTGLLFGAKVV